MGDASLTPLDPGKALLKSSIDALLEGLRNKGAERFDVAGWHYLEILRRRTAAHEGSVRRLLYAKLEQAIAEFAERFAQARAAAAELVTTACKKHPDSAPELQRLLVNGDFKDLRRLSATLEANELCAELAALVSRLEPAVAGTLGHPPAYQAAARTTAPGSPARDLKTVRESRATWARMSVVRQVSMAMKHAPINAGPINSHMLVLRSLAMMQEISPGYLSCLVSYVDAFRSLDPGEKDLPTKRKKATGVKTVKPTLAKRK